MKEIDSSHLPSCWPAEPSGGPFGGGPFGGGPLEGWPFSVGPGLGSWLGGEIRAIRVTLVFVICEAVSVEQVLALIKRNRTAIVSLPQLTCVITTIYKQPIIT